MSAGTLGTFSAYVFAALFLWFGAPLWLAIVLTIVFTMVMYLLTMFLILVCKIPDMLATCALQFVHAGLGLAFTGGSAVSAGLSAPKWFGALHGGDNSPLRKGWTTASMNIGKSPYIIIIMLLCVVVCWVLLERTKHGRYLYAMGGNKTAAKLSGINVKKYRFMAGMFAAVFIAVAGIVVTSRNSAAQINSCDSYLMSSLAAVFIGRSVGGAERPNALGTVVGALLISTLENGLTMCGVVYYVLPAVKWSAFFINSDCSEKELTCSVLLRSYAYTPFRFPFCRYENRSLQFRLSCLGGMGGSPQLAVNTVAKSMIMIGVLIFLLAK